MPQSPQSQEAVSGKRNEATMFPLVEAYLDGRVRRSIFCQQHNLSIDTFKYWQKKYHRAQKAQNTSTVVSSKPKPVAFVPVHVTPSSPAEQTVCELLFPNGVRLHFSQPVTARFLIQLIHSEA